MWAVVDSFPEKHSEFIQVDSTRASVERVPPDTVGREDCWCAVYCLGASALKIRTYVVRPICQGVCQCEIALLAVLTLLAFRNKPRFL